jgi:hypothetical protein
VITTTTTKQPNPWYFIQIMKISMKNGEHGRHGRRWRRQRRLTEGERFSPLQKVFNHLYVTDAVDFLPVCFFFRAFRMRFGANTLQTTKGAGITYTHAQIWQQIKM